MNDRQEERLAASRADPVNQGRDDVAGSVQEIDLDLGRCAPRRVLHLHEGVPSLVLAEHQRRIENRTSGGLDCACAGIEPGEGGPAVGHQCVTSDEVGGDGQWAITGDHERAAPILAGTLHCAHRVHLAGTEHPYNDPLFQYSQEFAFLMENQWLVELTGAPGAAPSELMLYYYDMLPFQSGAGEPPGKFRREAINDYIKSELIPAMQTAFLTVSKTWGFRWHPEWRSFAPVIHPIVSVSP